MKKSIPKVKKGKKGKKNLIKEKTLVTFCLTSTNSNPLYITIQLLLFYQNLTFNFCFQSCLYITTNPQDIIRFNCQDPPELHKISCFLRLTTTVLPNVPREKVPRCTYFQIFSFYPALQWSSLAKLIIQKNLFQKTAHVWKGTTTKQFG